MWIFGQVWLFSLVAFALGVLLTWWVWARPLRTRVADLERQVTRGQPTPVGSTAPLTTTRTEFTRSGARSSAFGGPDTYGGGTTSGGTTSGGPAQRPATAFDAPARTFDTPSVRAEEPPAEREPAVRDTSFFDEPDQYGTSWRHSLLNSDTMRSEPAAEQPPASNDTMSTPADQQDAAYFAYLDDVSGQDKTGQDKTGQDDPADDAQQVQSTLGHPTSFRGSDMGESNDLSSESTQLLRPVRDEQVSEPPDEPAGTGTSQWSGQLSGQLTEPEADTPQPTAPQPTAPQPTAPQPTAPEPTVPELTVPEPAASEPAAPEPAVPGTGSPEPAAPEPAPKMTRSGRPARSLFEPAARSQDNAGATWDDGDQLASSQPMGPFGPESALPRPDGSAPSPEFQVKARTSSMVFHTTSSPFYDRLLPQVWFRTAEDAKRAGFTSWERPEGTWGEKH